MKETLFILWCAIASSNFLYQWIFTENWGVAIERTFFEGFAIFMAAMFIKIFHGDETE